MSSPTPRSGPGPSGAHATDHDDDRSHDQAHGRGDEGVPTTWEEAQASPEFQAMRRSFRRFVFPMTAAFLIWYFSYVLLAAYATDFFATPVFGNVNVGILFGLGQFVSTALITVAYVRWANRHLDEQAAAIGAKVRLDDGDLR